MANKLLVICGSTATGKTSLALSLAKKFDGELISADSRQVYKQMDIGTGKDLPSGFEFRISNLEIKGVNPIGYYTNKDTRLWGYDLVEPIEEFSVSQYIDIAKEIISDIWNREKLPVLVGGSGLYIKGVVDGIGTSGIGKDTLLREDLKGVSVNELFEILKELNPQKADSLNASDSKNPARLIRAIEIAQWRREATEKQKAEKESIPLPAQLLFIGLEAPREVLHKRIEDRVWARIEAGQEEEIENLLIQSVTWDHQSMKALGYREWYPYFDQTKLKIEIVLEWIKDEKNYAKRQTTWFRKEKRVEWFDVTTEEFPENVVKVVELWNT